jgi:hypothetical protein
MSTTPAKPPEILDKIVDIVLAHQPRPKPRAGKKRKKAKTKSKVKTDRHLRAPK